MYTKIIIYLFHLFIIFPYLFYLGLILNKSKYKIHSKILIPASIIGFSYQIVLIIFFYINIYNIKN